MRDSNMQTQNLPSTSGSREWRKVLYEPQPYPDNWVPPTFLNELLLNAYVRRRRYLELVHGSTAVVQQISLVAFVATTSARLLYGRVAPEPVLSLCLLLPVGTLVLEAIASKEEATGANERTGALRLLSKYWPRLLRQTSLLLLGVYYLAPFLATLSSTIALDTVTASSGALMLLHLYFHDYSIKASPQPTTVLATMSVTTAVFATVLFASKMPGPLQVFAHVLLSLEAFLVFPFAQTAARGPSRPANIAHFSLTSLLFATSVMQLYSFSRPAAAMFTLGCGFVWLLAPLLFQRVQILKILINGPWDEARPPSTPKTTSHENSTRSNHR